MPERNGYIPVMNALRPEVQLCTGDVVHEDGAFRAMRSMLGVSPTIRPRW